jgi:hypothetical protein
MNQSELKAQSESFIRGLLRKHLQVNVPVYLYGSRARNTERWNLDYDLWIDADAPPAVIATIHDEIDASFVPFKVDIVTTPLHQSLFSEIVQSEDKRWFKYCGKPPRFYALQTQTTHVE